MFCTGHVMHMCLIIAKNSSILRLDDSFGEISEKLSCGPQVTITSNIFHIVYVALQLYMMFKYSNVIVNRSKQVARFAFMHCIASSIVFWVSTIINEIMDELTSKMRYHGLKEGILDANSTMSE